MTNPSIFRAKLFVGVGVSAMAGALAIAPERASAQAFQATPTVTTGAANIDRGTPGVDTITADTSTVVIDWQPDADAQGNALDFLPTGNTGIFQNNAGAGVTDFAILNRILPAPNGNIAVIDGTVLSLIDNGGTFTPGGFVAFYSPTGIFVGSNAVFDVGGLMLTTLDPDVASFGSFTSGGTMNLFGQQGSTAQIVIDAGAQIDATSENSFFIATAANIQVSGSVQINGSHAYVVGEQVDVRLSNGLFDIIVPVGADAGSMVIDGDVGGPSSTGAGDNHVIYAVARAAANPITMLFDGNLGFEPAASAEIVNGEIILSANHNVFGTTVAQADIRDGIDAVFDRRAALPSAGGDIFLRSNFTSNTAAVANNSVRVFDPASFAGEFLANAPTVQMVASNGTDITVGGDLLLSAEDFGAIGSQLITGEADAFGGSAQIFAFAGSTISVGGDARLLANGLAGADLSGGGAQGNATGGVAQLGADGGTVIIGGSATVQADAIGSDLTQTAGGGQNGGFAQIFAVNGGTATYSGPVFVSARAFASDDATTSTSADAIGGTAEVATIGAGSSLSIDGSLTIQAAGVAGGATSLGGLGLGGDAFARADDGALLSINGSVFVNADGVGGESAATQGGIGNAGSSSIAANGGNVLVTGDVFTLSRGFGGDGQNGRTGIGGVSGIFANSGTLEVGGSVNIDASGFGSDAAFGIGGRGGNGIGGSAGIIATGIDGFDGSITIGGSASLVANGQGGFGAAGDGTAIAGGNGGDGFGGDNQTANDSLFNQQFTGVVLINDGNGAYVVADGDFASIAVAGSTELDATGIGGTGGQGTNGGLAGAGGDGFGGDAGAGLLVFGEATGTAGGSVALGVVSLSATGIGALGGTDAATGERTGDGGDGFGGDSVLGAGAGTLTTGSATLAADGFGGIGAIGGEGTGGGSGIFLNLDGSFTLADVTATALGFGAAGVIGTGGAGQGGTTFIAFENGTGTITGNALLDSTGLAGDSASGDGTGGTGGTASIANFDPVTGLGTIGGVATLRADGTGSRTFAQDAIGGTGTGGVTLVGAQAGATIDLGSVRGSANGTGGDSSGGNGGEGVGGIIELIADGQGTSLSIARGSNSTFSATGFGGASSGGDGIGGLGLGGTATVRGTDGASLTVSQGPQNFEFNVISSGIGGESSVDGGIGGLATGGTTSIIADSGASVVLPATAPIANARGGDSGDTQLDIDGGDAIGGTRIVQVTDGATLTAELSGAGGTQGGFASGTGDGGDAVGMNSSLIVDNATFNAIGFTRFYGQAFGGSGAEGGDATGGIITGLITNGAVINQTPDAGGLVRLSFSNAAIGGNGTTLGGGDAETTAITIEISESTLNDVALNAFASALGGGTSTGQGGEAVAGNVLFDVSNSAITGLQTSVSATANGGNSQTGEGGDAFGGTANIIASGSQIATTSITANTFAGGGSTEDGAGGSAEGGTALVDLFETAFTGDVARIGADAVGGVAALGTQGDASAGSARLILENANFESTVETLVRATATTGGVGAQGTGGDASGGFALIEVFESSLAAGNLDINTNADAFQNGESAAGISTLRLIGGSADATEMVFSAIATSAGGANALGGAVNLILEDGLGLSSGLSAGIATFENGASGGLVSEAGTASLSTVNSTASFDTLTVRSSGETGGQIVSWFADGGDFAITEFADITATGGIMITAINGALIGGPSVSEPTASLSLDSQDTITFNGNNDNAINFGGASLSASAREIDINDGARIGAAGVSFNSIDQDNPAILGGDTDEDGFTLTQDEASRIEAGQFSFNGAELATSDPNAPDIIIRDIVAFGSLDDGPSRIEIEVEDTGIVRVEGELQYLEAGSEDVFEIEAGERIEIVTPGGIGIFDSSGDPSGTLRLESPNIWVADDDLIAQLQSNPVFEGRNELLAEAASGSADPLGYVRAGGVVIEAAGTVLVRNTGTSEEPGGILVGEGGLSIASDPELSNSESASIPLDVFAYGRQQRADGTFVTGEEFYRSVVFNRGSESFATEYIEGSEFNDCDIVDDVCGNGVPEEIEQVVEVVTNPTTTEGPITVQQAAPPAEEESDADFGFDFPALVDSPELTETILLEEPVASGGDSSLYGLYYIDSEDEDEDEEDEDSDR